MRPVGLLYLFSILLLPAAVHAQGQADKIANAVSAAPGAIGDGASVVDLDQTVLREGTNGWTCLPDNPDSDGNDPMCLDEQWLGWAHAWMTHEAPDVSAVGFGYMLAGGAASSNTDPYATEPTDDNEWMSSGGPHLMVIVPDPAMLQGIPTDPAQGGPWVMWRGTPFVHVMVPTQ